MIGDAFDRALRDALRRHQAARTGEQSPPSPATPDEAAAAISGALTARTIDRPRPRTALVRLRMHRRHWPAVHAHATRARLPIATVRSRAEDDPRALVIEADANTAVALRRAFPEQLEVIP